MNWFFSRLLLLGVFRDRERANVSYLCRRKMATRHGVWIYEKMFRWCMVFESTETVVHFLFWLFFFFPRFCVYMLCVAFIRIRGTNSLSNGFFPKSQPNPTKVNKCIECCLYIINFRWWIENLWDRHETTKTTDTN